MDRPNQSRPRGAATSPQSPGRHLSRPPPRTGGANAAQIWRATNVELPRPGASYGPPIRPRQAMGPTVTPARGGQPSPFFIGTRKVGTNGTLLTRPTSVYRGPQAFSLPPYTFRDPRAPSMAGQYWSEPLDGPDPNWRLNAQWRANLTNMARNATLGRVWNALGPKQAWSTDTPIIRNTPFGPKGGIGVGGIRPTMTGRMPRLPSGMGALGGLSTVAAAAPLIQDVLDVVNEAGGWQKVYQSYANDQDPRGFWQRQAETPIWQLPPQQRWQKVFGQWLIKNGLISKYYKGETGQQITVDYDPLSDKPYRPNVNFRGGNGPVLLKRPGVTPGPIVRRRSPFPRPPPRGPQIWVGKPMIPKANTWSFHYKKKKKKRKRNRNFI